MGEIITQKNPHYIDYWIGNPDRIIRLDIGGRQITMTASEWHALAAKKEPKN